MGNLTKSEARLRRRKHIRSSVSGDQNRPRLSVFRSLKNIYAQIIDDTQGRTLASVSSLAPDLKDGLKGKKKSEKAELVGQALAGICLQKGIEQVVFDRGGYRYHGRVKALAEGARKGGLKF